MKTTVEETDPEKGVPAPDNAREEWRSVADRFSTALVFEAPAWYASLFREIRDRIRPAELPPLEVTSKPVAVNEIQFLPWYVSLIGEIRDRMRPPKLPPLQITSKPVEVQELEAPPWYISLFREVRDRIRPLVLPPLRVSSEPVEVKELWGDSRLGKRALPVSLAIHIIAVALLVGMQLFLVVTEDVVFRPVAISLLLPPSLAPPAPSAPAAVRTLVRRVVQPRVIPTAAALLAPPELVEASPPFPEVGDGAPEGVVGGVPGGIGQGVIGEMLSQIAEPAPPEPSEEPVKPPEPPPLQQIEVSAEVQQGKLLVMIPPAYPPLAKRARIQGTVRVQVVITRDGTVSEIEVLEGHPLLISAAIDAVLKWRYRPTLLNGRAVEVFTLIDVNFRLT
jgi:protein TonB